MEFFTFNVKVNDKAIKLIPVKKEPNSWITKEKIKIPLFFDLEYKYLIFKNNALKIWEEISNYW